MDKKQAQAIVKNTFENPFDKNRFVEFIRNLLNSIEESSFSYKGNLIPDAYEQYISLLERIGKYTDGEHRIDILVVKLKKETSIERARTMQRNFIARYLNGSRGGELKDAALVAFVTPDNQDWRFSLVKMDYRFEEGKDGKVKVKEEFTPARRWSFLVGANEKSHTAKRQLVPIIADDEHNPTLAQLEEAFNIEKATREFFEKYRELFLWTKETLDDVVSKSSKVKADFEAKGVNTVDFTKKLLGQIVFLYFLQKKGWFGVERDKTWGTGSKRFLRDLFDGRIIEYENFFNDVLEPLFYDALARDRSDVDHFNPLFKCKIPFLNGGLFDPINNYDWAYTDILLPNELFSNTIKTKEGDIGNGILDVFDRFNFTVKEDEPLEKEVAVDPEMLGKVFENLLEVKDRKSKGTYYTPREIVHYMCQQSLINYLGAELNMKTIACEKIGKQQLDVLGNAPDKGQLDLSVEHKSGSLIPKEDIETLIKYGEQVGENEARVEAKGRETYTYFYRLPETIRQNAKSIDQKLANIKVCDPAIGSGAFLVGMMNEIVKARNVLTAYLVPPDKGGNRGVRTPYHFKRDCIENSLYGVDIDPGAVEIAKLRLWLSLVVDEEDIRQIKPLPNLDYKIVRGNSLLGVEKTLFNDALFKELEHLKPLLFNETSPKKKQEYKNQIDGLISQITKGHKEFDFEVYFSEVFHEKRGFDVVIANPPYGFRNVLAKEEKAYFRKQRGIQFPSGDIAELFIVFALQSLVRQRGSLTFIIPKKSLYGESWKNVRQVWVSHGLTYLMDASKAFERVLLEQVSFSIVKEKAEGNRITIGTLNQSGDHIDIFGSFPLRDIFSEDLKNTQIYKGMFSKSILDKIRTCAHLDARELVRGEIGISNITKHLTFDPDGNYPCVKGIDIIRYGLKTKKRYLKGKVAKRYVSQYQGSKLVAQEIIAHIQNPFPHIQITIFYDDENRLINDTCVEIKVLNEKIEKKFLLAYYQSIFCNWYAYNFIYNRAIRTMHFIDYYLTQIPIPKLIIENPECQDNFVDIVDKILAITKSDDYLDNPSKQAQVKEYERQIDQMVYKLYGLTPEEIAIVEGKTGKAKE